MTFADQRRYHDHMETVPFAKKQKLATEEVSATTAQGGKAAASVARKKKVVRVISKFLRLARSSPLLDHLKRTAERPRPSRAPEVAPLVLEEPLGLPTELGPPRDPGPEVPPPPEPIAPRPRGRPRGSRNTRTIVEAEQQELAEMARRTARVELLPSVPDRADDRAREDEAFDPNRVEGWEQPREDWRSWFEETMTLDPALQPGGEEDADLTTAVKEKLRLIPEAVKAEIRRAHHQLGHLSRDALLRMAKAAGKSAEYLEYIRHWRCPACLRRSRPDAVPKVGVRERAREFNMLVGVDLKEVCDAENVRHT